MVVTALLLAMSGSAVVVLEQHVAVPLSSGTPPATLAVGQDGSTTLGASTTSAETTLGSTPIVGTFTGDILEISPGSEDVLVAVELLAETATIGESMTLELDNGALTELQVDVTGGTVDQAIGDPLPLDAGAGNMVVTATGVESLLTADTVYTMQIIITPANGGGSEARYDYELTVT